MDWFEGKSRGFPLKNPSTNPLRRKDGTQRDGAAAWRRMMDLGKSSVVAEPWMMLSIGKHQRFSFFYRNRVGIPKWNIIGIWSDTVQWRMSSRIWKGSNFPDPVWSSVHFVVYERPPTFGPQMWSSSQCSCPAAKETMRAFHAIPALKKRMAKTMALVTMPESQRVQKASSFLHGWFSTWLFPINGPC